MGGRGRKSSIQDREQAIALIQEAKKSGARITDACSLLNISSRTYQRWMKFGLNDKRKGPNNIAHRLTKEEKDRILKLAYSDEFKDKSPAFIVPALADRGIYIASESTFYRILKQQSAHTHRRRSKRPIKRNLLRPIATAPNQVWSWDITYLRGPIKGQFYYLYMIIDIYSRKIIHWKLHDREFSGFAAKMITEAVKKENVSRDKLILHSDNGGPMKGSTMLTTLQNLGIIPSFSRPSISDDNPFSESLFKTLKYSPFYPIKPFKDIFECRSWVDYFVSWYNSAHLHSGIKFVTPNMRHDGRDLKILEKRKKVYAKARDRNPARWKSKQRDWSPVKKVHLNPTREEKLKKIA